MQNVKTLGAGLTFGLLVAMAFGQSRAPASPAVTGPARYQITAVRAAGSEETIIYILDNRTQAVSTCRQVNGKWESASAFQLPD